MHDERQQERADEEKHARAKEFELHRVSIILCKYTQHLCAILGVLRYFVKWSNETSKFLCQPFMIIFIFVTYRIYPYKCPLPINRPPPPPLLFAKFPFQGFTSLSTANTFVIPGFWKKDAI